MPKKNDKTSQVHSLSTEILLMEPTCPPMTKNRCFPELAVAVAKLQETKSNKPMNQTFVKDEARNHLMTKISYLIWLAP